MKPFTAVAVLLLLGFFAASACAEEVITLKPSQEEFRKLDSIKRISVADPGVVDAKVLSGGQQLMIRAINPGETTVTIFDDNEQMTVFKVVVVSMMSEEANKIRQLLQGIETINVRIIDEQIVVEGQLIREKDRTPLAKVRELYKDLKFLIEDKVSANQDFVISGIEAELSSSVSPKLLGDGVMLEGAVASQDEKSEAERISKEYVDNVYSVVKIQEQKTVASVRPVEFSLEENPAGNKDLKVLDEGLKIEKGIFGFILDDDAAADSMVQGLFTECAASAAFDGGRDFSQNGQYDLTLDGGEKLYIYFQIDTVSQDFFKVSVSLLDAQKKVLLRSDFYSKKSESVAVAGFYNILRARKLMSDAAKELVLVFTPKG